MIESAINRPQFFILYNVIIIYNVGIVLRILNISFCIAIYTEPCDTKRSSQLLCYEWITDRRREPETRGVYTGALCLLSKQQLLFNLTLCGLYSGAGNTPENTVSFPNLFCMLLMTSSRTSSIMAGNKIKMSDLFRFLAHPAFRLKMSLCHRFASVVCCLSSVHNSQEMLLFPQFLSDFNSVWFV